AAPPRRNQSTYNELTDSPKAMRRMVSASSSATESWRILAQACTSGRSGRVLVTTSWSSWEPSILLIAAPDSTGCTQYATTLRAPRSFSAAAAAHKVPAVSTMSSTITQVLPSTSPMMFITVDTLARGRRLSMIARSASSSRLAIARARTTPPTSGLTTIRSSMLWLRQMSASNTGEAYTLSTGMSKKPWIWSACRSTVSTRSTPAAPILPGVAEIRHHRGDAGGRGALQRVGQRQQLEQVLRTGRAGRLDHEHFLPANVLLDLDLHLAVAERADQRLAQRHAQTMGDILGQRAMGVTGKQHHRGGRVHRYYLETQPSGEWLGRQDSNLRMRESKSRALTSLATPQCFVCSVVPVACTCPCLFWSTSSALSHQRIMQG